MSTSKHCKIKIIPEIIGIAALILLPFNFSNAESLTSRLKGRILLQVESHGEAWYVNPENKKRYYLGRPADAFRIMRDLGLGISESDYNFFNGYAPERLAGKILLRVEANGEAYYVSPIDLKMHYLGRPADAFRIMRELGLGISNNDLAKIEPISNNVSNTPTETYLKYIKAINDGDINVINSLNIENIDYNKEEISDVQQLVEFLKALLPLNIRVVNEIIEGDRAILKTQGKTNPEARQDSNIKDTLSYGIVALKKINGQWKLYQSKWEDPVPIISATEDNDNKNYEYWDVRHFCNGLNNESECENIEWETKKNMCYSCFAELKANNSLCEKILADYDRENCYLKVAKLTGNKELCNELTDDSGLRESCNNYLKLSDFLINTNIYTIDSDNDGLSDGLEIQFYTDIGNPDTDGDGYPDGLEVQNHYSPTESG